MRRPHTIEHVDWPSRRGRARILIENPDGAELWAQAEALQEAGYDVASCFGPSAEQRLVCPLVRVGHCPLVEGADVVISTTKLADDGEVVAALRRCHPDGLIIQGTTGDELPIEQTRLLAAVGAALV